MADRKTRTPNLKLEAPAFKTEAEEATWWPTQEEKLFKAFT